MFETLVTNNRSEVRRLRKGATLALSLTLHAAVIAAVIVVPLLHADSGMPGYKIINAVLMTPPILPGVPPGRPGGNKNQSAGPAKETKAPSHVIKPRGFLAPVDIPTKIMDEDLSNLGSEESVGPLVDDSPGDGEDRSWILGKDIIPEEIKANDTVIASIQPPRLIKRVSPVYPLTAINARISGTVIVGAITDIYGRVSDARVISGHPLLNAAALEAVHGWLYEPYLVNGIPKAVRFTVTVTFALENR